MGRVMGLVLLVSCALSVPAWAYESPRQNVRNSIHYEWMLHHDRAFKHYRMRKECGPLRNDYRMWRSCMDSF